MKIHFEHKSTVFELERKPMPDDHFRAVCKLAGAVIGVVALVHMTGLMAAVLEVVALLLLSLYKMIPKFDD